MQNNCTCNTNSQFFKKTNTCIKSSMYGFYSSVCCRSNANENSPIQGKYVLHKNNVKLENMIGFLSFQNSFPILNYI